MALEGFTERLNEEFIKSGMAIKGLAGKMHKDHSTVRSWLEGRSQPKAISLARLCIALDTSADYLLFGKR
ncbi:MAG: helix-turn-helix transcriptional regulator [Lachnospiraceae bacterium]|nr:helix-turn-helix transcriptional regulator [Lachnospiraceae bacterium]